MKLVRFSSGDGIRRVGIVDGEVVRDAGEGDLVDWLADAASFAEIATGLVPLSDVHLLPPIERPGKILAIGLNYREHIDEQSARTPEAPIIFAKMPTAVIGPGHGILLPSESEKVDYEGELAVVIGDFCRGADLEEAARCIGGFTVLNDVTARDVQKAERQWVRAKGFDTFCPMGPWIVTVDELGANPHLSLVTRVNGEVRQSSNTFNMMRTPVELVSYLSQTFTLEPGDVIATGTPSGVGAYREPPVFLQEGDVVEVEIEGIGVLRNPVTRP